jgi:hypothetical protein
VKPVWIVTSASVVYMSMSLDGHIACGGQKLRSCARPADSQRRGEDEPATLRKLGKRVSAIRFAYLGLPNCPSAEPFRAGLESLGLRSQPTRLAAGFSLRASGQAIRADLTGGQIGRSRRSQEVIGRLTPTRRKGKTRARTGALDRAQRGDSNPNLLIRGPEALLLFRATACSDGKCGRAAMLEGSVSGWPSSGRSSQVAVICSVAAFPAELLHAACTRGCSIRPG